MILCDTGPLIVFLDADDHRHQMCKAILPKLSGPLVTTWPCFTEALYLAGRQGGFAAQSELWDYVDVGIVEVRTQNEDDRRRLRHLMERYRDAPMDFADASLVVMAETLGLRNIFTLDSYFHAYRINQRDSFIVIP